MTDKQLKVFLDSSVLIEALKGRPGAIALFRRKPERDISYVVSPVVIQELLLVHTATNYKSDPDELLQHVHVLNIETPVSPEVLTNIRQVRNRLAHTNDLLILDSARDCDLFLTYDADLLSLGNASGVAAKIPEDFLEELGVQL
jgi:predicted nucleic acid-binding protein